MPQNLNVLFLAAEADPFVKVGGLGDVAGALPRALHNLPADVLGGVKLDLRLVLPLHNAVRAEGLRPVAVYSLPRDGSEIQVEAFESVLDGIPVYFISGEPIRSSGSVYSLKAELDAEKYVFFSLAAMELPRQIGWQANLVHANDWHTAAAVYSNLARRWEEGARRIASLLTLHNLPFMGPDIDHLLTAYGLPMAHTDLPDWARTKPLPLGLWAADAIVPVSPSYAEEILGPDFGCGLQDFLETRKAHIHGILNGIDVAAYNPTDDASLASPFSALTLADRPRNKAALQERVGLPLDPEVPLFGIVSRMDRQKGMDLAIKLLGSAKFPFQAVILGSGDPVLEQAAVALQEARPDRVRVVTRFDAQLARQIYGGADMFLMPSRYEPCGLSQMLAMRYGCVPIVSAVGGLRDTVTNETGFVFNKPVVQSLSAAVRAALRTFPDKEKWQQLQRAGMARDYSWVNSAKKYFALYQSLVHETTPAAP